MNTATQLHPSTLHLTAAKPTPAQARADDPIVLLSREEVERQLCEVNARLAWYHELQALGYLMLALAGLGALLYSAAMVLGPAH
jgi:hypothetical protein